MNGTVVSMPHSEQTVRVSVREMPAAAGPLPGAAPGLAGLTTLGVVLELLIQEEELFPGGEDKFAAAISAG